MFTQDIGVNTASINADLLGQNSSQSCTVQESSASNDLCFGEA